MTDLTTLLECVTGLIVFFSLNRFARWFIKEYSDYSELTEKVEKLKAENAELKRKAVNNDERLSDIY